MAGRNVNYDILDQLLKDSQKSGNQGKWIVDRNHPEGGYYMPDTTEQSFSEQQKAVSDIEKYLRS